MTLPKLVIFDLDGTIYRGSEPLPYSAETVSWLLERGVLVRFFTNNSAISREGLSAKLTGMGIPSSPEWCYGTGPAAADFCVARSWGEAALVGEPSLHQIFASAGIRVAEEAPVLVSGICRSFDYNLLDRSLQVLVKGGFWLATNRDATYPLEGGRIQPGSGSLVAAIATAAGREPDVVLGKPSPFIVEQIAAEAGVGLPDVLMVGDREDTDIEAGRRAGCPTWMVLTGVTAELPAGQAGGASLSDLVAGLVSGV